MPTLRLAECAALAVLALSVATQAHAQAPASTGYVATTCPQQDLSREAADQRVLDDITRAGQRSGFDAIRRRRADLEAMLLHAPACYPQIERSGATVVIRSIDPQAGMGLSLVMGALLHAENQNEQITVVVSHNTYPYAAVMLGSYLNETRAYADAITWLDRGLALQPHDQYLITEKVAALSQLHRPQEAVDLLKELLADESQALMIDEARVQRILGETLIDLNRLDEAEAALRESIRIQPQNPVAQHELEYIASLRAGARPQDQVLAPSPQSPNK